MENRLETLRIAIDKRILNGNPDKDYDKMKRYISHMYGVARFCTLLAKKRHLNAELAATCGMLHDIFYMTGGHPDHHAAEGAKQADGILKSLGLYSDSEIKIVTTSILNHRSKGTVHGLYDELLKDADVMDHCLYNADFPIAEKEAARYRHLLAEFGIDQS